MIASIRLCKNTSEAATILTHLPRELSKIGRADDTRFPRPTHLFQKREMWVWLAFPIWFNSHRRWAGGVAAPPPFASRYGDDHLPISLNELSRLEEPKFTTPPTCLKELNKIGWGGGHRSNPLPYGIEQDWKGQPHPHPHFMRRV